ncbi:MAG: zinc-binding dehydrogenase [Proteobacteria bacterium]|nr:zinc-binding dehydrogenase [Pseudomonadota bacterium]
MTALEAVRDVGRVQAGQRVLVHGASGGVGSYAVQIAVALGAEVTAFCRTRHCEAARVLGAAHVFVDIVGGRRLKEIRGVLERDGTYVAVGGPVDRTGLGFIVGLLARTVYGWFVPQRLAWFVTTPSRPLLEGLAELVDAGTLSAVIDRRCDLAEVPAVLAAQEAGTAGGKAVISVG